MSALEWDLNSPTACFSCSITDSQDAAEEIQYLDNSITIWNVVYHCYDFVYICPPSATDKALLIGQIIAIRESAISVQYLGHYHDFVILQRTINPECQLVINEVCLFLLDLICI